MNTEVTARGYCSTSGLNLYGIELQMCTIYSDDCVIIQYNLQKYTNVAHIIK